jgi:hypothetical protein
VDNVLAEKSPDGVLRSVLAKGYRMARIKEALKQKWVIETSSQE